MEFTEFERGQRDMLNKLLALNPEAAAKLAKLGGGGGWADPQGRLPFDVAFWIHTVAEQSGIKSREEFAEPKP